MNNYRTDLTKRKWFFPVVYFLFIVISVLPPITEKAFSPENTQDVIINLLMVAITPYKGWGIVFHVVTLLIILLIALRPEKAGRLFAVYMGLDFFIIALAQSFGNTVKYGFVVHTSGLIAFIILGLSWIWVAIRGNIETSFKDIKWYTYILLPLALLAFWSPYRVDGLSVIPHFDPILLFTSPDYGFTFCFTTPVFLYLLILFYPKVNLLAYRITAFNGLLYALFNLSHWFNPDTRWMGVLHIPLLVTSIYALVKSTKHKD